MNDQPSPIARADDDTPPSPKRKKVRAKYAPKACVSCRRSKLKCSGENPCQRCVDNGKRCFYSEDQTAAEALQNLSRPAPVQPPLSLLTPNGHGATRRSILPRHEGIERRASDASVLGMSMEARMQRIENMMEALVQDRGVTMTPRGSIEREEAVSDGFQGESSFHGSASEPFGSNLVPVRQQLSFPHESPERTRHSVSAVSPSSSADSTSTIRIGTRNLVFPTPVDYQKYIDFFFAEIHPFHPCIHESDFRTRMLASRTINPSEVSLLALNYIIFACSDSLANTTLPNVKGKPPGWQWFLLADELVGKRSLSGRGDLSLLQFLLLEAIYFTSIDKPNLAYNTIGLATRTATQYGIHRQSSWANLNRFHAELLHRIFWTIVVTDRWISLSCGRPYSIRELDWDITEPIYGQDLDVVPDQLQADLASCRSTNAFQVAMVYWARLAGDVWDRVLSVSASKAFPDAECAHFDARLRQFSEDLLPTIPLAPNEPGRQPEVNQLRQHVIVHTSVNCLRLLLRRRAMLSLQYDSLTARLCGDLALDTISRIRNYAPEAKHPSTFRHHLTSSAAATLLALCTLLVRNPSSLNLNPQVQLQAYIDGFRDAINILHELALTLHFARRVVEDFRDIIGVVGRVTDTWQQYIGTPSQMQGWDAVKVLIPGNVIDFFPYREIDACAQSRIPSLDMAASGASQSSSWNSIEASNGNGSLDGWDFELAARETGYGVPWI